MANGMVFYQSTRRGLANPDGSAPVTYYGRVYRIPASQHGTIQQLEWELSPIELLNVPDGQPLERSADDAIERLEVIDQQTGDVWVMYRVPFRPSANVG